MPKVDKKDIQTASTASVLTGGAGYLYFRNREKDLSKGPKVLIYGGAPGVSGGFEAQTRGWIEALKQHNVRVVNTPASYNISKDFFRFIPPIKNPKSKFTRELKYLRELGVPFTPVQRGKYNIRAKILHHNPDAFLHIKGGYFTDVPGSIETVSKSLHKRDAKLYRAVSDYGKGNLLTLQNRQTGNQLSSSMYFPRRFEYQYYDKFITPDNELAKEVGKDKILNVKNLAIRKVWADDPTHYVKPARNSKEPIKIFMHWGGGHQGLNIVTPNQKFEDSPIFHIVQGLDEKFGRGNYELHLAGGNLDRF